MKTVNGMSFGFSAVNAGQRNVAVEPQLIAVSTEGNFRMTPPVSRALGLSSGDYIPVRTYWQPHCPDESLRLRLSTARYVPCGPTYPCKAFWHIAGASCLLMTSQDRKSTRLNSSH